MKACRILGRLFVTRRTFLPPKERCNEIIGRSRWDFSVAPTELVTLSSRVAINTALPWSAETRAKGKPFQDYGRGRVACPFSHPCQKRARMGHPAVVALRIDVRARRQRYKNLVRLLQRF